MREHMYSMSILLSKACKFKSIARFIFIGKIDKIWRNFLKSFFSSL